MLGAMKQMQFDSAPGYWITQLNVPNYNGNSSAIVSTSLYVNQYGSTFVAGELFLGNVNYDPTARTYSSVISITSAGALNYGETYTFANTATNTQYGSTQMYSIAGNTATGNVYAVPSVGIIPTISSASGALTQVKAYNGNYNYNDFNLRPYGPVVALSPTTGGNIITAGYLTNGIDSGTIISCIKDNGNILYTKIYGGPTNGTVPALLPYVTAQLDTSNNMYMGGTVQYYYSTSPYQHYYEEGQVYKINSSTGIPIYGTRIYNTDNGGPSNYLTPQIYGVAGDTTGNTYAVWSDTTSSSAYYFVSKWTTGGTPTWTRKTSTNISSPAGLSVTGLRSDASNNVYAFGITYSSSAAYYPFITKYNSSGTILWSKTLTSTDFPVGAYSGEGTIIDLQIVPSDPNGDFVIALQYNGSINTKYSTNLWKLPGNGTGNGTYTLSYYNGSSYVTGNVTYGDSGFTNSTDGYAGNVAFASGLGVTVSTSSNFVANTTVIDTFTANNYNTWGGPITTTSQILNI